MSKGEAPYNIPVCWNLRNLFGCSASSTKTNRPGATLKYELITDELCLTAASVGGEFECKTLADSE
ncbi:hypothetical protein DSS38_04700 [Salmonella enterica subsp. enterica]|nr:hypothetical protein [Salmonella enterica subsp. enterica serovar Potsdam]